MSYTVVLALDGFGHFTMTKVLAAAGDNLMPGLDPTTMDMDKGTYRANGEKLVTVGQGRAYTYRIVGDTLVRKGFKLKKLDWDLLYLRVDA